VSNYDKAYESIRPWLAAVDFAEASARLGLVSPDGVSAKLSVLGRGFVASADGVEQVSGEAASVNLRSVIVWYLTHGGSGQPTFRFTPLSGLSQGIFGTRSSDFSDWEWQRHAGLTLAGFRAICQRINAEPMRTSEHSESRLLMLFPKVAALLTYEEADDEYPAILDIKFDQQAIVYLPFETLAVAEGLISQEFQD